MIKKSVLLKAQRMELSESIVYHKLAAREKKEKNKKILERIAVDEEKHYAFWKNITGKDVPPNWIHIWFYVIVAKVLGLSFGLKLMELGEKKAHALYDAIGKEYPTGKLMADEHKHEKQLLNLLEEERLEYAGSIVLGLNDALVELTGALAGLTFAFRDGSHIALAGLIVGIAASLSMASSEFLSSREEGSKHPGKGAFYTGTAYILTVFLLVAPYFLLSNVFHALAVTLVVAIGIIALFNFYFATAKELPFWHRFGTMVFLSMGVALISFIVGVLLRVWIGVEL